MSRRTAPGIARVVEQVTERLALHADVEVYIRADSALNAFAPGIAHVDRPVAILNSGLVQLLSVSELAFPLGHELGHVGLGHAHATITSDRHGLQALHSRSSERFAEISADRIGLLAVRSTFVAANVMIKTASGLPSEVLGFDIDAFIAQMDRSPDEISREWELEMSHPSLPFRLWALLRFSHSDVYADLSGQGGATIPIADIDEEISERLAAMGDGRIGALEEKVLERALTWIGAHRIILSAGTIDRNRDLLLEIVGERRVDRVTRFAAQHGYEAVRAKAAAAQVALGTSSERTQHRFATAMERLQSGLTGQDDESAS